MELDRLLSKRKRLLTAIKQLGQTIPKNDEDAKELTKGRLEFIKKVGLFNNQIAKYDLSYGISIEEFIKLWPAKYNYEV